MSALPPLFIDAVGLIGPGFSDWPAARVVLAGAGAWQRVPTSIPQPTLLPAAERRRAGHTLRLAVAVAAEAAGADARSLATVFASSGGDGDNCHQLCTALAAPAREVSPTRFMNSVHNAAAGYWSLAAGSMRASSAVCAHDGSFAAGLLEAATQVAVNGEPVLLVVYDSPYPEPLCAARPIPDAFACALRLAPLRSAATLAAVSLALTRCGPTRLADHALETLRTSNPAARALPLLSHLAGGIAGACVVDYLDGLQLQIDVTPC